MSDNADRRLREARFDLTTVSAQSKQALGDLLAATLTATDLTDEDIGTYVGCTREDLVRIATEWQYQSSISLFDAEDAWATLANAVLLKPWRSWVPGHPAE